MDSRLRGNDNGRGGNDTRDEIKVLAPIVRGRKGEYHQLLQDLYEKGFLEVRLDGKMRSLRERVPLSRYKQHTIEACRR